LIEGRSGGGRGTGGGSVGVVWPTVVRW
jgi:hypothetical protein